MTLESLKPLLLVLVIGLVGISVRSILDSEGAPRLIGVSELFNRLVDECQEGNPGWERAVCERIVRGEIWTGMTGEMLIASLGEPRSIDRPRRDDSTYEEWTYRSARYGVEVMQVEDGILTTWTPIPSCESCGIKPIRE